jgi:hypothetical protein
LRVELILHDINIIKIWRIYKMKKKFFYEFSGNVFLEANDQTEAEKLVTGIPLDNYLIDEELYEIDENYIPVNLKQRQEQLGTRLHPLDNSKEYEEYKKRECRYGNIFREFLHGKFDKNELMKRMAEADEDEIDDGALIYHVQMVDLESKEGKTARLVSVE